MIKTNNIKLNDGLSPYKASITKEQFLFHEMRITAKLMIEDYENSKIIELITKDNLYQYPTEKSVARIARACIRRLRSMNDTVLINAIANEAVDVSKQICLYAMMKDSRLVWEFMITVIGEKYRLCDKSFSRLDVNIFLMRLQEQSDIVSSWSDSTIEKIKQVLIRILVENQYLDNVKAEQLNQIWLYPILESAIRRNKDDLALPAFNNFL